mmetsp:Transcript_69177/g.152697  ORF Transcript_69177/g.152697 Transcript_69177/m.152697 type:complete len:225 (+) Transcript_69177:246-920(+)
MGGFIQGIANGLKKLTDALDHVFLWQASVFLDADEIMNDLTNDLDSQKLTQEQVTDELHVGQHHVFLALELLLEVLWVWALGPVFICCFEGGWHVLKLVLTVVQQHSREGRWLLTLVLWRELRVSFLECKDHVCVGLAVVGLCQCLLEDDPNDILQLLRFHQLDAGQVIHDCREIVWANLVQQACSISLKFLHPATCLLDLVCILRWLRQVFLLWTLLHLCAKD